MSEREAFTPFEQAFFREGAEMDDRQDDAADDLLDQDVRPRSLLRRLFSRKSTQL